MALRPPRRWHVCAALGLGVALAGGEADAASGKRTDARAGVTSARAETRPAAPALVTESLPELLQRGANAFAAGDFATAAAAFSQVERDYGGEREWRSGTLPQRLLPLRGFAELRAGLAEAASQSLAAFLEDFPEVGAERAFALFALAAALREAGQPEAAVQRFAEYETENAGTAQAALAAYQRGELLLELDRTDEALATWRALAAGSAAESLRVPARLRALQAAIEKHRDLEASALLFAEPWDAATMPEIAVLAFAALELGDRMLASERPAEALRAYRLVAPKARLVSAQADRLAALKARYAASLGRITPGAGSFWVDFYRQRIATIEAQLAALQDSEDYTDPLRIRLGQALLLLGRAREAWLAFESVAMREDVPSELRGDAHYRWILAAMELGAWEEALAIARSYVERHPGSDLAPEALHLIARAHVEQQRFEAADEVLSDLLERFPQHASAGRARFTRGWTRAMQEQFAEARADFERYDLDFPQGPLAVPVSLWRALTWFFERRYPEALDALQIAWEKSRGHPLHAEICFRRGTTLYAMRDFGRARRAMEDFLRDFAQHPRQPDALVLLGDILMGAGELDAARRQFARIDPEATSAYVHGVFQTGKILKAQADAAGMIEHFAAYLGRGEAAQLPRRSEALYWIGWAEEQRGRPDAALPVYLEALDRFGNDAGATEIEAVLTGLERLSRRLARPGMALQDTADPALRLLRSGDIDAWIEQAREAARGAGQLTWLIRLGVFKADRFAARKLPHQEEAALLELAGEGPPEAFDAHALARVGLALQQVGSLEGPALLQRLLDAHPRSFARAAAFYGLAAEAGRARRFEVALAWIRCFEQETPTHPLSARVALLAGSLLEEAGQPAEAAERYQALLRDRSARGRPHAEALLGLARCHAAQGEKDRAISCCQRVYALYRAQRDLVAEAYLRSAAWFSDLGDPTAALATYREMLASSDIGDADQRHRAQVAAEELGRLVPSQAVGSQSPAATESEI